MKQYFTLPLMVVLAWLLGSCGGSDSTAGIEGTGSPVIATVPARTASSRMICS